MDARPRIKILLTVADHSMEIISLLCVAASWVYAAWLYYTLPAIIPIHFDMSGKPNGYGSKGTIWLMPVIATMLYAFISFINRFSHIFNYGVTITPENADRQYRLATQLLRTIKLIVMITLLYSLVKIQSGAVNKSLPFDIFFLPLLLIGLAIPVIMNFVRAFRK